MATASTSAIGKLSREEFRRQKDLDAARKAGTAPAALDEEGKAINPHIPQYISQAPWYLDTGAPSLAHQRREKEEPVSLNQWYQRGQKAGPAATKFRKGACENCGALTHKRGECMERPRKKGAKYTGKDIQADEIIQDVKPGYDAKRDRWNGYDPKEHHRIYEEYAAVEAARQKLREEEIDNQTTTDLAAVRKVAKAKTGGDDEFGSSDDEDEDEDKYADAADAVGQKMDTKTRITVRNLRIREDTAKYLRNLDPESAYYDPKTRSMREAPDKSIPAEESLFAGDNFLRHTGEATEVEKLQLFAWQSAARGGDVNLHSNPTAGEILHQEYKQKKEMLKDKNKVGILAKYGGEEYLQRAPKELLTGQTEEYVEYSRTGQVVKGRERVKIRSRYAEDVLINNHTTVWGSYYDVSTGQWGYACCHSSIHASYCAGEAIINATESSAAQNLLAIPSNVDKPQSLVEQHNESMLRNKGQKRKELQEPHSLAKKHTGEGEIQLDSDKLAQAIETEREKKRRGGASDDDMPFGKRKKHNNAFTNRNQEVTEEELEAYRMTRRAGFDDPISLGTSATWRKHFYITPEPEALPYELEGSEASEGSSTHRRSLLRTMPGLTGVFITSIVVILSLRFLTSNVFQIDNRNANDLLKGLLQGILIYQAFLSTNQLITIVLALVIGVRLVRDFVVQQDSWQFASTMMGLAFGVLMADMLSYIYNDEEWNIFNIVDEYTSTKRSRPHRQPVRRRVSEPRRIEDIPSLYGEASSIDSQSHLGDQELSDTEKEVSRLRAKALDAAGQRRRCREERKWALSQGNLARAFQLRWQIKKYQALASSFTHEADRKLIENDRAKRAGAPAKDRDSGREIDDRQRQMPFVQVVVENGHESSLQEPRSAAYITESASHGEGSKYKMERHTENKSFYTVSGLGRRGGATFRVESPPTSDTWSRQLD